MSSSTRVILDPKRVAESISPSFDFTAKCVAGDVLSSPMVSVSVWSGLDLNPSAVYGASAPITGLVVNPRLLAGVAGVIYLVRVVVTASLSGILELDGLLAVLPSGI